MQCLGGGSQGGKMKSLFFFLAFSFSIVTAPTYAAVPAKIVSIPRGAPVFVADGVKTTAIVRGLAANDPARVVTQLVKKKNFLKYLRPGMIKAINPWYIASMAAAGYIVMQLEGLQEDLYRKEASQSYMCKPALGTPIVVTSVGACYQISIDNMTDFFVGTRVTFDPYIQVTPNNFSYKYYKYNQYGSIFDSPTARFSATPFEPEEDYIKVTDEELYEHTRDFIADNPTMNHSDIFKNADASVNEDFFVTPEYNPDANEDDLTLLDLYRQGLLQTVDPTAPYYVTPEKLAEIEALAQDIDKEKTPEGEADALNDKLKQPITQAEFEESTAKHAAQATDGISKTPTDEADKTEQLDDDFGILDALLMNPVGLPSKLPIIPTPQHSSSCRTIDLAYKGYSVAFPSSDQCAKMNEFKKGIGYILYILTAFGIAVAALRVND